MIHIHNGDVIAAAAKRADIAGEHIAFRESLVTGPVVLGDDWIETRARAIADAHGQDLLRVRTDLLEQEQTLDDARGEIVLWFEHDLYCLIHLIYLLQRFGRDASLSLVWCPFPLSENEDHGLQMLFESREAVTPELISLAQRVWSAYTSPDPTALNEWLRRDSSDLPFLREGIALHASRFPSDTNGLGAIEQRALTHIANGFTDFATLFDHLNAEVPRFGFGDTEVFRTLKALARRPTPLLTLTGDLPKVLCTITPAGESVLRGEIDDMAINDPDLWLGGAHLTRETQWRWTGTNLSAAS
ncbi:MAG: hypothetical protein QOJ98_1715 [Acidobacteriota bacterium]|nr:hypothetical protein [Acidobacteriota bacterium]